MQTDNGIVYPSASESIDYDGAIADLAESIEDVVVAQLTHKYINRVTATIGTLAVTLSNGNLVLTVPVETGDKGLTGDRGAMGATGDKGIKGAAGPVGNKGPVGDKGLTGNKGVTGARGPIGIRGQDAYWSIPKGSWVGYADANGEAFIPTGIVYVWAIVSNGNWDYHPKMPQVARGQQAGNTIIPVANLIPNELVRINWMAGT
jgi:Collagen triple helix repeat (20 copies)